MKIKLKKLYDDSQVPTYATIGDAGADLYSYEDVMLQSKQQKLISTGVALEIPENHVGMIRPRSGLATKHGVGMNSSGVIDSGYRGELKVCLINHGNSMYHIKKGDRIAQLVVQPVVVVEFEVIDELSSTERSNGGHGSSGQ